MHQKSILYVSNTDWYFQLHWLNRANAGKEAGYKIKLIAHFTSEHIKEDLEKAGIECYHVAISRSGINPFTEMSSLFKLYKKIKLLKPDLIHSITVKPNIYSGIIGLLLNIPVIKSITGTGIVFSNRAAFFRCMKVIVVLLYRLTGNGCKGAFVFENREDQVKFHMLGISRNQLSIFIPGSGVDPGKFKFSEAIFENKNVVLLFAARLLKDKGLDTLISALDRLYLKRQDFKLYIAGMYDLLSRNAYSEKDIISLTRREYVCWLGKRDDIEKVLHDIDIVVLPTRYGEGIPRILIEAGFTGRSVVATDIAGCREIIEDHQTGYLLQPGNDEQLTAIIEEIMISPNQAKRYAYNLYHKVNEYYSDEVIIKDFLTLYRNFQNV